MKIITNIPHSN